MSRTNLTLQSDYSKNGSYIKLSLPIQTECLIPVDDSVRLINQVSEEIDYREFYLTYSSEGRKPAVSPKTLFKIMIYAYSQHIYSSGKIEKVCNLNLAFKHLLGEEKVPGHNTIARFRKEHLATCVEGLLTQLINLLAEADEIQFENLFIDGTKTEANANKYSFVWRGTIEKSEATPPWSPAPAVTISQVLRKFTLSIAISGITFPSLIRSIFEFNSL